MIPDVPFVEGDRHPLAAALIGADELDRRGDGVDIGVELGVEREIFGGVFAAISEIHVQRDVIDRIVGVLEDDALPLGIGLHIGV
jgi:hypothetical protein